MLNENFIYLAATIRILGGVDYIRATLSGKAKPNPLTWLLWSITPMVAFLAEVNSGAHLTSIVTLAVAISPLLVFISAMIKNPRSIKLDFFNLFCAGLSISGIVAWTLTSNPMSAIWFAIFSDLISALPTLVKSYKQPKTEHSTTYALNSLSMLMTFFTLKSFSAIDITFPIYIFVINLIIVGLIYIGRRRQKN